VPVELRSDGLELHLRPAKLADGEGWAKVHVAVRTSGFGGEFTAWLEIDDLRRFADELHAMETNLGREAHASLAGAEPDIAIELTSNHLGHIAGHYVLESGRRDGVPTALSGAFDLDQSYLQAMQRDIKSLIAELLAAESL
jgi:hypothetical protein